jgi:hypothetical protein
MAGTHGLRYGRLQPRLGFNGILLRSAVEAHINVLYVDPIRIGEPPLLPTKMIIHLIRLYSGADLIRKTLYRSTSHCQRPVNHTAYPTL